MAVVPLDVMANNHGQASGEFHRVSSIQEFSDVQDANHWAYEHLLDLIKTQKCVAGFHNQDTGELTFRGDQPITRYEMVALLNSCLYEQKPHEENPPEQEPDNQPDCPNSESTSDLENLEGVTILVIKNNDTLENLNLSNLEKLTTLIIKGNNNLTQLKVPYLAYLTDIRIENNDNLRNIKKYKKPEPVNPLKSLIDNFWESLQSFFNDKTAFIIKHNKCLGNLTLENLNHLRELRIMGNKNLTEITFGSSP